MRVKDVATYEAAMRAGSTSTPESVPASDPAPEREMTRAEIKKMLDDNQKNFIKHLDTLKKDILESIKKELHEGLEDFTLPEPGPGKPAKRVKLNKEREERANALLDQMLELELQLREIQEEQEQENMLQKNRSELLDKLR